MVVQYQTYFRQNEFSSSIASPEKVLQLLLPILHRRRHATESRHLEVFLSLSGSGLLQSAGLHSYTTHLQLQHSFCKIVASILSTTQGGYFTHASGSALQLRQTAACMVLHSVCSVILHVRRGCSPTHVLSLRKIARLIWSAITTQPSDCNPAGAVISPLQLSLRSPELRRTASTQKPLKEISDCMRPASSPLPRGATGEFLLAPGRIQGPLRLVLAPLQLRSSHHHYVPLLHSLGSQRLVDACAGQSQASTL